MKFIEKLLLSIGFVLHTTNSLEAGMDRLLERRDRATSVASNTEKAYSLPIKGYFRFSNKAKRRIVFDRVRNRFEVACPEFNELAIPRGIGVCRPPAPEAEKLYLNLLPRG